MSKKSDKRARIVCIKAYELAKTGLTNRQIAYQLGLRDEQVAGKIKRGEQAVRFEKKPDV